VTPLRFPHIPAIHPNSEFVSVGGLMSYASSIPDAYRTMGNYTCAGFQRHKTYAFASSATHQTGACDQPQHGESARPHNPTGVLAIADEVIE
jgi:hypothetical protein